MQEKICAMFENFSSMFINAIIHHQGVLPIFFFAKHTYVNKQIEILSNNKTNLLLRGLNSFLQEVDPTIDWLNLNLKKSI